MMPVGPDSPLLPRRAPRPGRHSWPVTLQHGEVVLAPLRQRDGGAWERVRRQNSEWLRPWEATLPPGSEPGPATFPGLVRMLSRQAREGRMLPWLVWFEPGGDRSHAQLAGQLTVSGIVGGSASWGQIGYWVDQRLAGRGIIPTAVALAVDYCFRSMRLHRIEVAIRPENVRSLRVVAKLGFRPEGLRPRYLHIDGDWRDHLVFALNAEEVPEGLLRRWDNLRQR
jgi:[ribosomal protein S5]-alanine N-acetyltransferase